MSKTLLVAIFFLASFIASCSSLPRANEIPVSNTKHTIYFIYRNWHTSIVLDAKPLALQSAKLSAVLQRKKFARIGWGDGDYFTGKNKTWSSASKALIASQYSALQLLTYDDELLKEIPADTIVPLAISDNGLQELIRHIDRSIAMDKQNAAIKLHAYSADTGVFFQATEHYSVFNNCNTWSGQALRLAGLPVKRKLTAQGVFEQAQEISRIQTEAGLFRTPEQR